VSRRADVAPADQDEAVTAADESEDGSTPPSPAPSGPAWLQPQTVRLVVSGLTMVYLVGLVLALRGFVVPFVFGVAVLVVVVVIVLLTSRWWDPLARPLPRSRARTILALAGIAVLIQIVGIAAETGYSNDFTGNAPSLLLVVVLFFNCLS
jgi:hypothetical protein